MKILITGGAGFIGSNFVRHAINGDYEGINKVTVLDKLTYAGNLNNFTKTQRDRFEFIHGDICNADLMNELVPKFDSIINFAAESHVDRSISNSRAFFDTNTIGVQTLLETLRNNPQVRMLQVSTDEVYGSIREGSWDENFPLSPNSPYSASKASAELLIKAYFVTYGLDVVTTRCSNNYGPFHYPEKLIPLFITNLILGKKVPVYGTGANVRDWLHVDDHCRGILAVLLNGKSGNIYNIGGGKELSNLEIAKKILLELSEDETRIEYVEDRPGHDFRYSVNWNKIRDELDYQPQIDFEKGLRETIDWYQSNELWWKSLLNK
jgi:dTDP-glucose 4,6-dehydratase